MRYLYFLMIILITACSKDKLSNVNNDLVPIRIGSTWKYQRIYNDTNSQTIDRQYTVTATSIVNIDLYDWYKMESTNSWGNEYDNRYWRCDATGFYTMYFDPLLNYKSTFHYPLYNGNNYFETVKGNQVNNCITTTRFEIIFKPSFYVLSSMYDAFQYAQDTVFVDSNCIPGSANVWYRNSVIYLSRGTGIIKQVWYPLNVIYDVANAPDSLKSYFDELVSFTY